MSHEHDHFPLSKGLGGTTTVPACLSCHDLKDRVPLANRPIQLTVAAYAGLLDLAAERIGHRDFTVLIEGMDQADPGTLVRSFVDRLGDISPIWTTLPSHTRLIYSKLVHVLDMAAIEDRKRVTA